MLCDPIPEPNYKKELLTDLALGKDVQPIQDLVWLAYQAGYRDGLQKPKTSMFNCFWTWLGLETGLELNEISINKVGE